jgi:hypothetical protein
LARFRVNIPKVFEKIGFLLAKIPKSPFFRLKKGVFRGKKPCLHICIHGEFLLRLLYNIGYLILWKKTVF